MTSTRRPLPLFLLILAVLLAGCRSPLPGNTEPNPPTVPTANPERIPATPVATLVDPTPTPVVTATATVAPVTPSELPHSTLFPGAWDDRSPYVSGLISSQKEAADILPEASIYHIDVNLSDDLTQLQGRQEVRYTNAEEVPLDAIYLRLFPNIADGRSDIANLTVNGQSVAPQFELQDSLMVVPLPAPLDPGESVILGMDFSVQVPTNPGGNYGTFALLDDILALAHFYPMIAVYDDEGWNAEIAPSIGDVVYSDTAFYLVRVQAPADQRILTSGVELAREEKDDRVAITFAAGPVRDFYLVASDRYEVLSQQIGETTINAYAPGELGDENAYALRYASDAFQSFSERFGQYPFTELDLVGTPTLAGGVEYPGIVVVALGIYDPQNRFFEGATAHEVGHQWFYSLVGNDQIDEPWLDESITQYALLLYYLDTYGPSAFETVKQMDMQRRWDNIDQADIPIGLPVSAYEASTYSGIIYGRGALFLQALEGAMGKEVFAEFLRDYVTQYAWRNADTAAFQALAEEHCDCDLTALFQEWVYP